LQISPNHFGALAVYSKGFGCAEYSAKTEPRDVAVDLSGGSNHINNIHDFCDSLMAHLYSFVYYENSKSGVDPTQCTGWIVLQKLIICRVNSLPVCRNLPRIPKAYMKYYKFIIRNFICN